MLKEILKGCVVVHSKLLRIVRTITLLGVSISIVDGEVPRSAFDSALESIAKLLRVEYGFSDDEIRVINGERQLLIKAKEDGLESFCKLKDHGEMNKVHVGILRRIYCGSPVLELPEVGRYNPLSFVLTWDVLIHLEPEIAAAVLGYDLQIFSQELSSRDPSREESLLKVRSELLNYINGLPDVKSNLPVSLVEAAIVAGIDLERLHDKSMVEDIVNGSPDLGFADFNPYIDILSRN